MADIIDKEFVAIKFKEYAGGHGNIAGYLGPGGSSWGGDYGQSLWAFCEAMANAINEKVVPEFDKEKEERIAAIEEEAQIRADEDQAIINILNTTYKDKINEIITAANDLGADPAINPLP